MLQEHECKAKKFSGDKADSLRRFWFNVNITTFTPKFTDVSKRHVNKDLYSIQNCATISAYCFNTFGAVHIGRSVELKLILSQVWQER
jgi:hypothetical protein